MAREKKTAEAVETAAKKPAKKTAAKKSDAEKKTVKRTRKPTESIVLQFDGQDVSVADLKERALAQFASVNADVTVKKIDLYLKPEDHAAYYVMNGEHTGQVNF